MYDVYGSCNGEKCDQNDDSRHGAGAAGSTNEHVALLTQEALVWQVAKFLAGQIGRGRTAEKVFKEKNSNKVFE